ncbi:hypothetical protein H3T61_01460 [Gilliamella sp. B14384H2]|uniref:hypothetical protein n=1 Tax=unclassified Gilliamella TaxID=2685620 RepID=UPI0018DC21F1|nr:MULTISPECIES: hypothetical protein [unclassified Gilliamella]MBI0036903.1 hypothetical protein [Gilliamella sp. B14384G10]MBI0039443.1 hypothetical protein [Gilliamella sp. B14384G7]MBI0050898.1 hypothetical protein [Gilliamella sp. B14384G13]MBI0053190.1 hypothetical protein [Gilliamella sp. B14384H2]
MMRIIIACLLMFLLMSCSHERTSQDAYAEGSYLESINLLAAKIEEKSEVNFKQTDAEKLSNLVNDVMNKYEDELASTNNTDYKKRIEIYQKLLEMNKRLTNRFYSTELVSFLDKYPDESLRQIIAKDFYDYGNSITGTDSDSYHTKAELYKSGLSYYSYKNIATLYKNANTKYMQIAAKDFYEQGKDFEKQKDYKAAAEAFSQASSVYQPLGKYKDSDKRAYDNGKKYATLMAEAAYQEAKMLAKSASKRVDFRTVGEYYRQAANVYSRFGRYKDAASLANTYKDKGVISVYCDAYEYCPDIRSAFSADYITFVGSPNYADIKIRVASNSYYSHPQVSVSNETKFEKVFDKYVQQTDDQGHTTQIETFKELTYYQQTAITRNSLTLSTEISVTGLLNSSRSFNIEKSSEKYEYIYSGNVPSHIHNYNEGTLDSQSDLQQRAKSEQSAELRSKLESIVQELSYL